MTVSVGESRQRAHLSVAQALVKITAAGDRRSVTLLRRGAIEVEVYAPRGVDDQTPHDRDEIYVIMQGDGVFFDGESRRHFQPGDTIFVPAGVEHRFEEFTPDFATWVIFVDQGEPENAD